MIPKKIHQIFFQIHKPLDQFPIFLKSISAIQKYAPEYDYKLWNETDCLNLLEKEYPVFLKFYTKLQKIQQIDFMKYILMYHYGGFYIDLDIIMLQSPNDLTNKNLLLPKDSGRAKYRNSMFGSVPHHELWFELLTNCDTNYNEKKKIEIYQKWKGRFVLQTTGPWYMSRIAKKVLPNHNADKDIIFDRECVGELEDKNYYFIDYVINSWVDPKNKNAYVATSPKMQRFIRKYSSKMF